MPYRVPGPEGYYSNESGQQQEHAGVIALGVAIGDHVWPSGWHVARLRNSRLTSMAAEVSTGLENPAMRVYDSLDYCIDVFGVAVVVLDVTAVGRRERNALVRHIEERHPHVLVQKVRIGERRTDLTAVVRSGRTLNRTDLFEPFLHAYRRGLWLKAPAVDLNHAFMNALEVYEARPKSRVAEEEEWRVDESDSWVVPLALAAWALNSDSSMAVQVPRGTVPRRSRFEANTSSDGYWSRDLHADVRAAEREVPGGSGRRIGPRPWSPQRPGSSGQLPNVGTDWWRR